MPRAGCVCVCGGWRFGGDARAGGVCVVEWRFGGDAQDCVCVVGGDLGVTPSTA